MSSSPSRIALLMSIVVALLLSAAPALAQNAWNLQLVGTTSTTIEVSWTLPTGVTSVRVILRDADGNQLNAWGPLGGTSRVVDPLLSGTTYKFVVQQLGDATNASNELTASTDPDPFMTRVTRSTTNSISLAWTFPDTEDELTMAWVNTDSTKQESGSRTPTSDTSFTIPSLTADNEYQITMSGINGATGILVVVARDWVPPPPPPPSVDDGKDGEGGAASVPPTPIPPPPPANTCPDLLPDIVVSGYVAYGSQCQVVAGAGVGRQDLLDRGVVSAVDIWSLVPSGVEVCFRNMGAAVVFLDAAYSPRLLSALEYTVRNGHTCAVITTAGTVVLLAS